MVNTHDQQVTHHYSVRYPEHGAREGDPHYKDFDHIKREWSKDPAKWVCSFGASMGDFSECSLDQPLEIHHDHIEWALLNGVDLARYERQYPGVSDPDTLGAWVESAANLVVLCVFHHRGHGGAHVASASDYEAQRFVKGLIS